MDARAVAELVAGFSDGSDGEALKSRDLVLMLLRCSPAPFSRSTFTPGHITATALVMHPSEDRVLLVFHNRLQRWLLPGGHVESTDITLDAAAGREAVEETGVELAFSSGVLVGVDVHGIPSKRGEPYHLHHDVLFRFRATSDRVGSSEECREVVWCGRSEMDRFDVPGNVRRAWSRAALLKAE